MTTQDERSLYEGMFIISAKLSDDARNKALEKIKTLITNAGGENHTIHEMGRKRLAYEIDNHREGYYYLIYFSVNPDSIGDLWSEFHLSEDLIRFMTMKTDKICEKLEFQPVERG